MDNFYLTVFVLPIWASQKKTFILFYLHQQIEVKSAAAKIRNENGSGARNNNFQLGNKIFFGVCTVLPVYLIVPVSPGWPGVMQYRPPGPRPNHIILYSVLNCNGLFGTVQFVKISQ